MADRRKRDTVTIVMVFFFINCSKGTAGKELKMENEEMSKADLIAMLVSIREVARTNGETHTVEHIEKILEEVRK